MSIATRIGTAGRCAPRRSASRCVDVVDHQRDRAPRRRVATRSRSAPGRRWGSPATMSSLIALLVAARAPRAGSRPARRRSRGRQRPRDSAGTRSDFEATRIGVPRAAGQVGGVGVEGVEVDDDIGSAGVVEARDRGVEPRASRWRATSLPAARLDAGHDAALLEDRLDVGQVVMSMPRALALRAAAAELAARSRRALGRRLAPPAPCRRSGTTPETHEQHRGETREHDARTTRRVEDQGGGPVDDRAAIRDQLQGARSARRRPAAASRPAPRIPAAMPASAPGAPVKPPPSTRQDQGGAAQVAATSTSQTARQAWVRRRA